LTVVSLVALIFFAIGPFWALPFISVSFLFYLLFWVGLTLSVNLLFGFTKYIPFGYFAFYGVGSYGFALSYMHLNVPQPIGVLIGGVIGVILGFVFIPMLRLDGVYFAIANFAGAFAIAVAIPLTPRWLTGGAEGIELSEAYSPILSYYAVLLITIAVVLISVWLIRSRVGLMLKSVREDPIAAESIGINRRRIRLYVWVLSAGFAGLYGAVDAWNTAIIDPVSSFDTLLTVKPLLYAIFGGPGFVLGPIIGAAVLYLVDSVFWVLIPLGSYLMTGVILMVIVMVLPRGLMGEYQYRKDSISGMISKFGGKD